MNIVPTPLRAPILGLATDASNSAPTATNPAAPTAEPATQSADTVRVSYTPQDPGTLPAVETTVPRAKVGATLSGPRIAMDDTINKVTPDADGNYLFAAGTPGFQQSSSFAATDKTLTVFEDYLGHAQPWAFDAPLKIHPHFQDGFNAFYLRLDKSVNFFDGYDPVKKAVVHGSESLDVVSHEVGHAILDGMKPGLVGWFGSLEAKSFHEAFGDVAAILTALHEDSVLDRLVAQTGGDLKRPNLVAGMAEEFSQGINHAHLNGVKPDGWTLRNANNPHVYVDPETLPKKPADIDDLFQEPHSFSTVFTGATWDIMAAMTSANLEKGMAPRQAITTARDAFGKIFAHGVELGPNRMKKLSEMADGLMAAEKRYFGGQYAKIIGDAFTARHIEHKGGALAPEVLPSATLPASGVTTLAGADAFLATAREPLGVSAETPMKAEQTWRNDRGETFVRYGWTEEMPLDAHTYTELGGSLTLGFDADGKLFHKMYEPVDDEQRTLARAEIDDVQARLGVRDSAPSVASDLKRPDGLPYEAYIERDGSRRKLVKVPMAS